MDNFEKLNIYSSKIRKTCEDAFESFGSPLNRETIFLDSREPDEAERYLAAETNERNQMLNGFELQAWRSVEINARMILNKGWGGVNASPFKTCAATVLSIVSYAPVPAYISEDVIRDNNLHPNFQYPYSLISYIALDYCLSALHTSIIGTKQEKEEDNRVIENPISCSKHFATDMLATIAIQADKARATKGGGIEPVDLAVAFNLLSLLFEALAYKSNQESLENDTTVSFPRVP